MISIVASKKLTPTPEMVAVVAGLIATAHPGECIGFRCNDNGEPASPIEYLSWVIARSVGRATEQFSPKVFGGTFKRDYQLATSSRLVVAFFKPGLEMLGGTGHVVKAAIDRMVQVEAYSFDDDGNLILIGSETGSSVYRSRPDVLAGMLA